MSSDQHSDLHGLPFFVDTTPYCLWDVDTPSKNLELLRGLRPDYFSYLARTLANGLSGDAQEANAAAMALRVVYGHVAETVVALVLASIQAGNCLHAWLDRYSITQLVSLCKKVEAAEPFPTMLAEPLSGWSDFSKRMFRDAPKILESPQGPRAAVEVVSSGIAKALTCISADLCRDDTRAEYNSYKHGLRVIPAGLAATISLKVGEPIEIPGSPFGSMVMSTVPFARGDRINLVLERRCTNWDPTQLVRRIHVAVACLDCVRAYLLQELSRGAEKVAWRFFPTEEDYSSPWIGGPRLMSAKLRSVQFPDSFPVATAKEVHDRYKWPEPVAKRGSRRRRTR